MTKLVNIKHGIPYDIYCGRGIPSENLPESIFANPFIIGKDGNRYDVIAKFKNYFYHKIDTDKEFASKVLELKDKTLGCWCLPEKCHCQIIIDFLDRKRKNSVIIAGSRQISDYAVVESAVAEVSFDIHEVVCGCARGVDTSGRIWAEKHNIPVKKFPARWDDLAVYPCNIKTRHDGTKYNSWAGHIRNKEMARYATHLILIWDGKSSGSASMKKLAKEYGLIIHEKII